MSQLVVRESEGARRQVVLEAQPGTILKTVLEEACSKLKLNNMGSYGLRYGKMNLDLSLPLRLANVPTRATLEIIRVQKLSNDDSNQLISAALQFQGPQSRRIILNISPTETLCRILELAEGQVATNNQKGQKAKPLRLLSYHRSKEPSSQMEPVCLVNNQRYAGMEVLRKTTLADLGITSGSILIRVSYLPSSSISNTPRAKVATSPSNQKSMPEASSSSNMVDSVVEDEVKVYKPSFQRPESPQLPDSFYELTSEEAKYYLSAQKNLVSKLLNQTLKTKKTKAEERRKAKEELIRKYAKTRIKLKFPDQLVVEFSLKSNSNVGFLFEKVASMLQKSYHGFSLSTKPPYRKLKPSSVPLVDLDLVPASVVYLDWETEMGGDYHSYLNEEYVKLVA